jgi:predicted Zn-dependent peptidase
MLNRKTAPEIVDAVDMQLQLKPYTKFQLDNGVPVYTVDGGSQEVLMIELVFFAGNWYEEKNIVAATTNFMLKNGTKQKNAFAINEHFEFHGAYLNRSCHSETATLTLHCLNKQLSVLLPAVAEIITESVFPADELAIYQQNQKQRLAVNLKKCDFVANRLIDEYVYGIHHPYGKYTSTLDFDQIERADLAAFYSKYYTQGNCMIFAAGKLPADLAEQLNKVFGHLSLQQHPLPDIRYEAKMATEKKQRIINDADGVQGAIRLARPFFNRHHPDFSKVQFLNNVFGGYFGSRLMTNIREDKGYTYGIHSHIQNHIHDSAIVISTEAGRDVCEATVNEVYKEMDILCNELIEEEEMDLVRNYMLGSLLGDLDGPFHIIGRWKSYLLNNVGEDYFYKSIETVKTVTPEELRSLAKQYLNPADYFELVVI